MRRSFDVAFPRLSSDAELDPVTWRSGRHSDLTLRVGDASYCVHKVIVGYGVRASAFLNRAFLTDVGDNVDGARATVDLTTVLPTSLWNLMEQVLDFIYTGALNIQETFVVKLFACAEILQIEALFDKCRDAFAPNGFPTVAGAPLLLADAALVDECVRAEVVQAATACILKHFDEYTPSELSVIPICMLKTIIGHDKLNVMHEDWVFDTLKELIALLGSHAADLWSMCRFPHVSADRLAWARKDVRVLPDILLDAFTAPSLSFRESLAGIKVLIALDKDRHLFDLLSDNGPIMNEKYQLAFEWSIALRASILDRGGNVEVDWLHSLVGNGKGNGKGGWGGERIDPRLDVVITSIDDLEDSTGADRLKQLVDAGVALVIVRGHCRHHQSRSPYEPLNITKGKGRGATAWQPTRMRAPETLTTKEADSNVSKILCGVDLDALYPPAEVQRETKEGLEIAYRAEVAPGALVVTEAGNDNSWRAVCAIHPNKLVATLWHPLLGNIVSPPWSRSDRDRRHLLGRALGRQLIMNLVLFMARRRRTEVDR